MIVAKNIYKSYGELNVLKGVSLSVDKGEVVAIVGASGAGKTSLLQILGTLEKPDKNSSYHLRINGIDLPKLSDRKISAFRNHHIGFIFQFHQLLPEFTALENICIPAFIAQKNKQQTQKKSQRIFRYSESKPQNASQT